MTIEDCAICNRLQGEVALVTGSTKGIGEAIAHRLAREGAAVAVTGRSDDLGRAVAERIVEAGGTAHFVQLDQSDETSVQTAVAETIDTFGDLSVLVNNAAATEMLGPGGADTRIDRLGTETFDDITKVGIDGLYYCCKTAVAHMVEKRRGSIINISSGVSLKGVPDQPAYTMTKGAMNALTTQLAVDLGPHGIRVNTIIVGFILSGEIAELIGADPSLGSHIFGMQCLDRHGLPEDIAAGAAYLASEDSRFVTGAQFNIDGGITQRLLFLSPQAAVADTEGMAALDPDRVARTAVAASSTK